MTIHDELHQTRQALLALEKSLVALRNQLGAHLDVLRLLDDLDRCRTDLHRLEGQLRPSRRHELVAIPDGDYDESFWADAEHEGLGRRAL